MYNLLLHSFVCVFYVLELREYAQHFPLNSYQNCKRNCFDRVYAPFTCIFYANSSKEMLLVTVNFEQILNLQNMRICFGNLFPRVALIQSGKTYTSNQNKPTRLETNTYNKLLCAQSTDQEFFAKIIW